MCNNNWVDIMTLVVAACSLAISGVFLYYIRNNLNLLRIETLIKLEEKLDRAEAVLLAKRKKYTKSESEENLTLAYHSVYKYLNILDRMCFFIIQSGKGYRKNMKSELYDLVQGDVETHKDLLVAQKASYQNIQNLCKIWGINFPS